MHTRKSLSFDQSHGFSSTPGSSLSKTFRFYDMPRELRDIIYSETLGDVALRLTCELDLSAQGLPSSNLLLVSRQMKDELEEQSQKPLRATIKDAKGFQLFGPADDGISDAVEHIDFPSQAYKAHELHFSLAIDHDAAVVRHLSLIQDTIGRMPKLKSLTLKIGICEEAMFHDPEHWRRMLQDRGWTQLAHLVQFEVFETGHWFQESFDQEWTWTLFRWNRNLGQLEAPELSRTLQSMVEFLDRHAPTFITPVEYSATTTSNMNFDSVKLRLRMGEYTTPEAFITDVLHVVRNGKRISENDAQYYLAHELETRLWDGVRKVPHWGYIQLGAFQNTDVSRESPAESQGS